MSRPPFQSTAHRAFCLEVHEARKVGWRVERRFEHLFAALEIACRGLDFDPGSMVAEARPILQRVAPPLRMPAIERDDLPRAMAALRDLVLPGLEAEAKVAGTDAGKAEWMAHHRFFFVASFRQFDQGLLELEVDTRHLECAEALLKFCIVLRNCRSRAYSATAGAVVGFPALLGPVCDALESVVIAMASTTFKLEPAALDRTITAMSRGSMVRLEFDPYRGGFSLEFPALAGDEQLHHIENMFTVVTHGNMVTRVYSQWGCGGMPVVGLMGPDAIGMVEGTAPLEKGYLRQGTIILELTKERLSMWFADPVLEPVVEYSYHKLNMRYWLGKQKQVGGWPVPGSKDAHQTPVSPFGAFDIPLSKIPMVARLDSLSVYAVNLV